MKPFATKLSLFIIVFIAVILNSCSRQKPPAVTYQLTHGDYQMTVSGEGELEARNAQVLTAPAVRPPPTLSYLIDEGSNVEKGDIIAKFTSSDIETEYLEAKEDVETEKADAVTKEAQLNLQLLLYESQMTSAKAAADAAKLQAAKLDFEAPRTREIKSLEIAQNELEAERARKNLESLKKIQTEERADSRMRIRQAENNLDRAKVQLDQLTLKAPYSGIVVHGINPRTGLKVKQGEILFRRMPVAQLPDLSTMQVNMKISETDAQKLSPGMPARVRVPSIGTAEFPGKVARVDRVAKPIKRDSKVKKVEVTVQIDTTADQIRPGLTAVADVTVRSFRDVLAVPHECVFERDSIKVVYVKKKEKFEARPIAVLFQDEDFLAAYGELAEGDQLAMRDPGSSMVRFPDKLVTPVVPAAADTFRIIRKQSEPPPDWEMGMPPGGHRDMPPEFRERMRNQGERGSFQRPE
jgi:HlyD family secretion protein